VHAQPQRSWLSTRSRATHAVLIRNAESDRHICSDAASASVHTVVRIICGPIACPALPCAGWLADQFGVGADSSTM
jgi:hypothetical protein